MDGGPPCFPPGFTCPAVLGAAGREAAGSAYGALTLCGAPSHALPLARRFVTPAGGARPPATRALNPGAATRARLAHAPVWAGPLSLAATRGVSS